MGTSIDLVTAGEASGLQRLSCSLLNLEPRDRTERLRYDLSETVYYVTSGYGILRMASSSAEFDYPVKQGHAIWLSDSADHSWVNDGEGPLRCLCVKIRVDKSVQERGKEVQRRIVDTNALPVEELDRAGTMKVAFRGGAIGSEWIDTVEHQFAPPGGTKVPHYNFKIEGIRYILRGKAKAVVKDREVELKAGDLVALPVGARRGYEVDRDSFLECVVLSILV